MSHIDKTTAQTVVHTTTLSKVRLFNEFGWWCAGGFVKDDARGRFRDGDHIHTSKIKSIDFEVGVITTLNSSYKVASWADHQA